MSVALVTHSFTIKRPNGVDRDASGYGGPAVVAATIATQVPGALVRPRSTVTREDAQEDVWLVLLNVGTDLTRFDLIVDEVSLLEYRVEDVAVRLPDGPLSALSHIRATVRRADG